MRQIYERAVKVFVWLGRPDNEASNRLAFKKLKSFEKRFDKSLLKSRPYRPWWWPTKPRSRGEDIADFLLTLKPTTDKKVFDVHGSDTHNAWLGIVSLWKKSWWTRTWVFQESTVPEKWKTFFISGVTTFRLPTKVKFLCGNQQTTWNALRVAYLIATNILSTPAVNANFLEGATQNFAQLAGFRDHRILLGPQPFIQLLQAFRHTSCRDPRDKVYAPLCLAKEKDIHNYIEPNYENKTVLDVYTDVVRYYLTQIGHELDFLGYAKHEDRAQAVATPEGITSILPSWVPNFSANVNIAPIPNLLHVRQDSNGRRVEIFHTKGISHLNAPTVAAYSPLGKTGSRSFIEGDKLRVSGVYIDALKDIIPEQTPDGDAEAASAYAARTGRRWAQELNNVYCTGESFADACHRTIVLDVIYEHLGRPSQRGNKYDTDSMKKQRNELGLIDYRYQMNMKTARVKAFGSRSLALSRKLCILVIPDTARIGDKIWALCGGQVLYILRPVNPDGESKQYLYVGECYAHGLNDGEIVRMLHTGEAKMEDISLV